MLQKALTYKATMHRLKPLFFFQLTLLSNNPVLTSYLSGIYLKSWFSWLRGGVQKTLKKSNWIFQIIIGYYNWIFLISFVLSLVGFFVFVFVFFCCCCCCFFGARNYRRMIFSESLRVYMEYSRTRTRHS